MTSRTIYRHEADDPCWEKRLGEAFNMLETFAPELRDAKEKDPFRTAYNRITCGEWDAGDVLALQNYGRIVASRARDRYAEDGLVGAPWRLSVLTAADRLEFEVGEFVDWFQREAMDKAEEIASHGVLPLHNETSPRGNG